MDLFNNRIVQWIIFILIIIGILLLFDAIFSISNYFQRASEEKITERDINIKEINSNESVSSIVENSIAILNFIDQLIEYETSALFVSYSEIDSKYDIKKINTDMEQISTKIYDSLKKDIFTNNEIYLNPDYIMQYITDNVTIKLIDKAMTYNNSLLNR